MLSSVRPWANYLYPCCVILHPFACLSMCNTRENFGILDETFVRKVKAEHRHAHVENARKFLFGQAHGERKLGGLMTSNVVKGRCKNKKINKRRRASFAIGMAA